MSREGFNQSRPFFGCFIGTLSPSRRHRRSTRLSLTRCPAGELQRNSAERGPARISQQGCNPTIPVTTILTCQLDHIGHQTILVSSPNWQPPLRGSMLPQDATSTTLRDVEPAPHMVDTCTTTRRAQKFPRAASDRISLSSVRSDTARRNRSFSF